MFEKIVIRQQRLHDSANPLDVGALVEAMVFYGETHLVLTPAVVVQLAQRWTPEGLIEIAEERFLNLSFSNRIVGILSQPDAAGVEHHKPVVSSFHDRRGSPPIGLETLVPAQFEAIIGHRVRAGRLAKRLCRLVETSHLDYGITDRVGADLRAPTFASRVFPALLALLVPDYPQIGNVRFEITDSGNGFLVSTNIDFRLANELYHRVVPISHSSLTPAYLLGHVVGAREALEAAAARDAEIATNPAFALAAAATIEHVLHRGDRSRAAIGSFQEFVFDDARSLRETVNSGSHSVTEIIALLKHARRFHEWLRGKPPETDLIKQYLRDCTRDTWVDRLPAKSARWLLFTGVGAAIDAMGAGGLGTAIGLGVSAGDAFFLDKIIRGWRPSQFIEENLREFVQPHI